MKTNPPVLIAPNAQYQQQIEKYAKGQYVKYHAGDDGWTDVLAQAKASPAPPAGFTIKPAPTPAEQAHNMVVATPPDLHLCLPVLLDGLRLVESLQGAVVPLVEPP